MSQIIAGRNPVIEALKAGRPISRILLSRDIKSQSLVDEIMRLSRARQVPVEFVARQAVDRHSAPGDSQGVVAFAAVKDYLELDDIIAVSAERREPALYCVLDGIEDPNNLGAILRTAEATGVHGVVIRQRRAVGLTEAVARASAGAVEYVPVARVVNISRALEALKENGVWAIGIDMGGQTDFHRVDFTLPTAIVIGGEGRGLSPLVKKRCDAIASIPMRGKIGSLNASVAAAVVMYEALRQRSRV